MEMLQYGDKIGETSTFTDRKEHEDITKIYDKTLKAMVHTVEEYQKWIKLESEKDEKELSIYQVGKLNPKHELMKNVEEVSQESITQSLDQLIKYDCF